MELETIAYFLTLAECLNFSESAERNHISQSSFSKAIIRLEKEIGVSLFDRSRHPIKLTETGSCFYEDMKRIYPQYVEAIQKLEKIAKKKKLRLLTCPKSYAFRAAISDYCHTFPNVCIEHEQTSEYGSVAERLLKDRYDFAIAHKPMMIPPTLKVTELYDDQPYLLVGAESALASKSAVSFHEMNNLDFYESPFSWHLLHEMIRYFHFEPKSIIPDLDSTLKHTVHREEVIHRVSKGKCVSIYCSRDVYMFKDEQIRLLPIREMPSLPMVLLEKVGLKDTPEKDQFRQWAQGALESYVYPQVQISL